ncbi:aminoacyl-tRNA hydrolase [Salaquimonas pukyongi]|uniref:aminoacyl-tRNA hydrolase n=1 Tax=Salaquimonas pukyongi TaxID=2712698 RepID=UPI00096B69D9|nr:aminoacyl-tRNA hydrolase [Salaquimonas pukyongi]
MRMLVGLGNPGDKYAGNRHNIGFMAADEIHRRHSFSPWRKKFRAEVADGELAGKKVLLVKPLTMMNLSGESVGEAMRFYKLAPGDITVFYDELDLAPGKVRVKTGGGSGGHNGIKSIDAHCGKDYARVRLGIGHPGDKARVTGHVLGDFSKADLKWLDPLLEAIGENAHLLVSGEHSTFMNRVAQPANGEKASGSNATKKAGSHIHQARTTRPRVELPQKGPMADMLKKLFGKE